MDLTASQLTSSVSAAPPAPISVIARVRPAFPKERVSDVPCIRAEGNFVITHDPITGIETSHEFDTALPSNSTNSDAFEALFPLLSAAEQGFPLLELSYGVTSAGKSHTLFGSQNEPGVFQMAVFHLLQSSEVEISAVQIYMNQAQDLITGSILRIIGTGSDPLPARAWKAITTESLQSQLSQILQNREVASTKLNSASSRSHCLVFVRIRSSTICFVDLAGSEPHQQEASKQVQQEGAFIRTSLLMLDRSLKELRNAAKTSSLATSFRSSALTMALRPFLQLRNKRLAAQICMFLNLHQCVDGFQSNKETLQLGLVTKEIRNYAKTPSRIQGVNRSVRSVCGSMVGSVVGRDSVVEIEGSVVQIGQKEWEGVLQQLYDVSEQLQEVENEYENDIFSARSDFAEEMKQMIEIEVNFERMEWLGVVRERDLEIQRLRELLGERGERGENGELGE
ncbi:Kinesin-like protein [Spironucleus salmonicida]|uniref:Kinesin-like protein n=1 Tax=Spironucleus salmonicida TaxID=348837 RepID=V6LYP1_9EUKA|nr:Kinesin-like protein [Spironucleus salmonicida]|eukprot:EST48846.1 Kinesin [Spironucleus salmonicida]